MFTAALLVWSIAAVFIRIVGLIVRELSLEARSAYTILPFSVVVLDGLLEDLAFARRYQCLSVGGYSDFDLFRFAWRPVPSPWSRIPPAGLSLASTVASFDRDARA